MTTTGGPDIATRLAYLEGRMDEQTALLRQIVTQLGQIDGRIDQVNARIDENTREVNGRFERLHLAVYGIGGTIIAGLIGVIVTLILQV